MPKGFGEADAPASGISELREAIRSLELNVRQLRGKGPQVIEVLTLRDRAQEALEAQIAHGVDVRPERTRLETIDNMIRRQAMAFSRELATSGGMSAAREERQPPEEYWWWFIDIEHAARLRKSALRYGLIFVAVLVALVLGNWLLNRNYGLDPTEQAAYDHSSQAEMLLQRGEYAEAIAEFEAANEIQPDAGNYAWLAALYDVEGDAKSSAEALAMAESLIEDKPPLYTSLALCYDMLGDPDKTEEWAYKALAIDDEYAQAWLYLGSAAESRGDTDAASKLFDEAARLASEQGNDSLYVLARMRMGMIMGGGAMSGAGF